MLERILYKVLIFLLERALKWAASEVQERLKEWEQNKADREKIALVKEATSKEKKIQRARDLINSTAKS